MLPDQVVSAAALEVRDGLPPSPDLAANELGDLVLGQRPPLLGLLASDGLGGEAVQDFVINVRDKVLPIVEFIKPAEGQRVTGRMTVSGKVVRGTLEVVRVQIRIDAEDWLDAYGNYSWSCTVDTTGLKNGRHILQARAYDGYDFSLPVNRTIIVDNPAEGMALNLWLGAVLVLMAAASAAVLLWRKRHKSR
ncbi:MAG: Ig-like domain-containing protein [Thermoplasmata archaeon]